MSNSTDDLPFSQRYGYMPIIQQLALGEIPKAFKEELKALLDEVIPRDAYGFISSHYEFIVLDIIINVCGENYEKFSTQKSSVNN